MAGLQQVFEDWESKVDQLEDHVSTQGFLASHIHARAVVDWALEECRTACEDHLQSARAVVEKAAEPLGELKEALKMAGDALSGAAGELAEGLSATRQSVAEAVSSLVAVSELLASFSFVAG